MANTLTYLNKDKGAGSVIYKNFSCLLSGNYVNSGGATAIGTPGEVLSFNTAVVNGKPVRPRIPSTMNGSTANLPSNTDFIIPEQPQGYTIQIERNATAPTANNYVARIFTAGSGAAAPAELGAGAYPAGLTAAAFVIKCRIPLKND